MTKLLLLITCLFASAFLRPLSAQESSITPQNHVGVFAGIEWNTISGVFGVSYERSLLFRKHYSVGVKGIYAFPYQTGNMKLLGGSYDGASTFAAILPSIRFDMNRLNGPHRGFYLQSALGILRRRDFDGLLTSYKPGFEAGMGWQIPLGSRMNLRWSNSLLFAGAGGILQANLALGF